MEKIINKYNYFSNTPSDINEHMVTLKEYSDKCDTIIEMGVRSVVSTWAFLISNPKKLISYDIVRDKHIDEVISIASEYSIDYIFIENDVLKVVIPNTDMLFIDTLHTYKQLIQELTLHNKNVNKYIILHDTHTFGNVDERIYSHASELSKTNESGKCGLKTAIVDFLNNGADGNNWAIEKEFVNNNGLIVLKRI